MSRRAIAALVLAGCSAAASAQLRPFSEAPGDTGAIGFNIGDRFAGPGALSFGRLGARRQIVLPEGEWVALAGSDWRTLMVGAQTLAGVNASMSTVVFGRFDGDRLVTMLRITANTRPAPTLTTGAAIAATWLRPQSAASASNSGVSACCSRHISA